MKISACMIAKNEENNISRCLNSYKGIVDEMIVVDTGSTDRTKEKAKEIGAKVYDYKWHNDFAAAKNYALEKAKGNWIIFLDADEYFDNESAEKLRGVLRELKTTQFNAVGCKIINIDRDKEGKIQGCFLNVRIFKNNKNIRYIGNIHERIDNLKGKINIASYYNDIIIYHTGYSTSIGKEKAQRNLDIMLDNIRKNNEDEKYYYHYLSDCYLTLGEYDKAIRYSRLQIKKGKKLLGNNIKSYINIMQSLAYLDAPKEEREKEIKHAIKKFPDHPSFHLSYADFLIGEKRYSQSLEYFEKFLKCKEKYNGIEADHTDGFMDIAYMKTGYLYHMKNNEKVALSYYYKSLQKNKYSSDTFQSIVYIGKQYGLEETINIINSIYNVNNERDIEFILDELIKMKYGNILAYYTKIWYKNLGKQDKSLTFTLLTNGKYETTFKLFYEGYKKDYSKANSIFTILSAILSNDYNNIELIKGLVKPTFNRIINLWLGNEHVKLYRVDIQDYLTLFKELLLIDKTRTFLNKYIKLKNKFDKQEQLKVTYEMAKTFQNFYKHEEAILLYKDFLKLIDEKHSSIKIVNMALGYCHYKLKEYKKACKYFENSIKDGYRENDIREFLQWIEEQTNEKEIKNLASNLINQFNELNSLKEKSHNQECI